MLKCVGRWILLPLDRARLSVSPIFHILMLCKTKQLLAVAFYLTDIYGISINLSHQTVGCCMTHKGQIIAD